MSGVLTRVRAAFSTQTIENKRIIFRHRHRAPRKQGNYPVYVTKWDIMRHFVKKLYEMKPGTPFCFNDLLKPWKSAPSGQS